MILLAFICLLLLIIFVALVIIIVLLQSALTIPIKFSRKTEDRTFEILENFKPIESIEKNESCDEDFSKQDFTRASTANLSLMLDANLSLTSVDEFSTLDFTTDVGQWTGSPALLVAILFGTSGQSLDYEIIRRYFALQYVLTRRIILILRLTNGNPGPNETRILVGLLRVLAFNQQRLAWFIARRLSLQEMQRLRIVNALISYYRRLLLISLMERPTILPYNEFSITMSETIGFTQRDEFATLFNSFGNSLLI